MNKIVWLSSGDGNRETANLEGLKLIGVQVSYQGKGLTRQGRALSQNVVNGRIHVGGSTNVTQEGIR
jgi:hypothetical protein